MKPIKSVGQFLSKLEKKVNINESDWFYRGENQNFHNTRLTATLYRGTQEKRDNDTYKYNTWKTYLNAMRDYYQNLSMIHNGDEDNFMALCQHHAIPTPLLDVSTSPLVALYFASQGEDEKPGKVYVFNQDHFIPFNNRILSYKYLLKCYRNNYKFPLLINNDISIKNIYSSVKEFVINADESQGQYINNLITRSIYELIKYLNEIVQCITYKKKDSIIGLINELDMCKTTSKLKKFVFNNFHKETIYGMPNICQYYIKYLNIFNIKIEKNSDGTYHFRRSGKFVSYKSWLGNAKLLLFLIYLGNQCRLKITKKSMRNEIFIPKGFNFYTTCTLNWGRIRAQKSKFLIQMPCILVKDNNRINIHDPHKNIVHINSDTIIHKPKSSCDFTIINKKEIRKQLNILGINKMNLFMDRDSIANYVKNRYYSF